MIEVSAAPISREEHDTIRAHYDVAAPLLTKHFGGTPTIAVTFPFGLGHQPIYRKLPSHVPATIETVDVQTATRTHRYVAIWPQGVTWLVAEHPVVELHAGRRRRPIRCALLTRASRSSPTAAPAVRTWSARRMQS